MSDESSGQRYVVTVAASPAVPDARCVRVATERLEPARLASGRLRRGEIMRVFVGERSFRANPSAWAGFSSRITVVAEAPSPAGLLEMIHTLRGSKAVYQFSPETIGDATIPIMAASLGVPIGLVWDDAWPSTPLEAVLDYFLQSPTLNVPIEPFYSLAAAIGRQREASLATLFAEELGRHFFIDTERRVTLSERWARRGRFFGTLTDSEDAYRQSDLWRERQTARQRVFVAQTGCAFCEHYPWCDGLCMTAADGEQSCAIWKRLMDRLVASYRQESAKRLSGAQTCPTSC